MLRTNNHCRFPEGMIDTVRLRACESVAQQDTEQNENWRCAHAACLKPGTTQQHLSIQAAYDHLKISGGSNYLRNCCVALLRG
jgi:hypothetical protein